MQLRLVSIERGSGGTLVTYELLTDAGATIETKSLNYAPAISRAELVAALRELAVAEARRLHEAARPKDDLAPLVGRAITVNVSLGDPA